MISFDVMSLFRNVPLEKTIDIIIKKVYKEKRIKTKIKQTTEAPLPMAMHQRISPSMTRRTYKEMES